MEHDYRDVLRKAASYVEQGWCQNSFTDRVGNDYESLTEFEGSTRWCLLGAIKQSAYDMYGPNEKAETEASLAEMQVRKTIAVPQVWNDSRGRTADEVAEALRQAADA